MTSAKEMKIAVLETHGWGGICHYAFNLCAALKSIGKDVTLLTSEKNELQAIKSEFTMALIFNRSQSFFKQWYVLLRYLMKTNTRILHMQNTISARRDIIFLTLLRFLHIKIIYTAHDLMPHDREERDAKWMGFAFRCIYKLADKIIVHSDTDILILRNEFHIEEKKIDKIEHGNYDFFPKESVQKMNNLRKNFGIGNHDKVMLCFGSIRRYKGIDKLIDSYKDFRMKGKRFKILVVGRSPDLQYTHKIKDNIRKSKLDEDIIIHDKYILFEDVRNYFMIADIVALPYEHIHDSGVLRIAFSCEKPLLSTKVGSFKEYIIEGKNGFFVDGSKNSFIHAFHKITNTNKTKLRDMGKYSKQRFKGLLDWNEVAKKTMNSYEEVLQSQHTDE
jgi:glycosyltransferase involved in cell wall biosynthesis